MTSQLKIHLKGKGRNPRNGFSLVEVAMSLAIVAFASVTMVGLIPFGLTSFHQAMNNTVESSIVQNLTNNILLTSFSNLQAMAASNTKYYFDSNGVAQTGATGAIYAATVKFTDLSPNSAGSNDMTTAKNPLNNLTRGTGTVAVITITKAFDPKPDSFSIVIASDQQISTSPAAATW